MSPQKRQGCFQELFQASLHTCTCSTCNAKSVFMHMVCTYEYHMLTIAIFTTTTTTSSRRQATATSAKVCNSIMQQLLLALVALSLTPGSNSAVSAFQVSPGQLPHKIGRASSTTASSNSIRFATRYGPNLDDIEGQLQQGGRDKSNIDQQKSEFRNLFDQVLQALQADRPDHIPSLLAKHAELLLSLIHI